MIFTESRLPGAFVIDIDPIPDARGFFARTFCKRDFLARGLNYNVAQCNLAFNHRSGIVRGLHFQFPPSVEAKLVRCSRGAILDVIVDLRPESPTYLEHAVVELTAENRRALYVPPRFAHGYQVLADNTEAVYQVSEFYTPEREGGLRHDDPRLAIAWPLPLTHTSDKDRGWRLLDEIEPELRRRMTIPAGGVAAWRRAPHEGT